MTNRDFLIKWLAYALALLPVWFAQAFLLSAYPLLGVKPMLLPLCAMAVAALEGPMAGAGFGLGVGLLMDSLIPGVPGADIFLLSLLGFCGGLLTRYILRQDFGGCFLCSVGALAVLDLLRILLWLFLGRAPLNPMLQVAGKEILWSLCFTPLVYLLFYWVYDRVPKPTVL